MRNSVLTAVLLVAAVSVRADQFLPTAEGTSWEYDSNEVLTGVAPVHSIVTIRASKGLLDGKEEVKFETLSGGVVSKTELVRVDEHGIVCLARSGRDGKIAKLNPPEIVVVAPPRVGATWDLNSEVAGIKTHQHFTVVAEETVMVPAGKFRAFHLHCEDLSLISIKLDRWFVPGTGFVKEATVVRGPGVLQRVTLELRKLTEAVANPETVPSPVLTTPVPQPSKPPGPPDESNPSVSPKKLTVDVSGDPAGGLTTEFKSDVANIYVRWQGHNLAEGARVRVAWVAEDVGDIVEPNFVIDETETVAPTPNASARFTLGRPPDGWAEGKYRVEFYVDDALVETVRVAIAQ